MSTPGINFSLADLQAIHQTTLAILAEVGLEFPSKATCDLFRQHNFKLVGNKVFIQPDQLDAALKTAPISFTVRARNSQNDLPLGDGNQVLAPTAGATQVILADGTKAPATINHYRDFARLVQTSPFNMPMSHQVCAPQDLPLSTAYLDMFLVDMTMTDRVLTANTSSPEKVVHFLEMLKIIFGGQQEVEKQACSINVINPCTPLKYAADQSESLLLLASANQPVAVTNMMMLGATAPISVVSALALGNAEILGGVVLTQLARPGAPVIYGSTSCPMDMKTMVATLGTPETLWLSKGAQNLAKFYNLPCRTGGSLTDSHLPDAQALLEGTLLLNNALSNGAHYIFHSFGMVSSYLAASFEKFVIDEEMAAMILASLKVPEVTSQTLDLELIKEMGSHGDYLTHPSTVKGFRSLFRSKFINRSTHERWEEKGGLSLAQLASAEVNRRLAQWEKPSIDPQMEKELENFIVSKHQQ